jgi:hypothetical protein
MVSQQYRYRAPSVRWYGTYFAVVRVMVLLMQKISIVWYKTLSCQHCFQLLQNKTKIQHLL